MRCEARAPRAGVTCCSFSATEFSAAFAVCLAEQHDYDLKVNDQGQTYHYKGEVVLCWEHTFQNGGTFRFLERMTESKRTKVGVLATCVFSFLRTP